MSAASLSQRTFSLVEEPCRLCINWVNDSDCEISMPQEVCPSRRELDDLLKEVAGLEDNLAFNRGLVAGQESRIDSLESKIARLAKAQELVQEPIETKWTDSPKAYLGQECVIDGDWFNRWVSKMNKALGAGGEDDPCRGCPKDKESPSCNEALYSYNCVKKREDEIK